MAEEEPKVGGKNYEEFLADLDKQGVHVDNEHAQNWGEGLLRSNQSKSGGLSQHLILVGGEEALGDAVKGLFLNLLMRTIFQDGDEMNVVLDWFDWCCEFAVPLTNVLAYVAALPSIGGQSRGELIQALTMMEHRVTQSIHSRSTEKKRGTSPLA